MLKYQRLTELNSSQERAWSLAKKTWPGSQFKDMSFRAFPHEIRRQNLLHWQSQRGCERVWSNLDSLYKSPSKQLACEEPLWRFQFLSPWDVWGVGRMNTRVDHLLQCITLTQHPHHLCSHRVLGERQASLGAYTLCLYVPHLSMFITCSPCCVHEICPSPPHPPTTPHQIHPQLCKKQQKTRGRCGTALTRRRQSLVILDLWSKFPRVLLKKGSLRRFPLPLTELTGMLPGPSQGHRSHEFGLGSARNFDCAAALGNWVGLLSKLSHLAGLAQEAGLIAALYRRPKENAWSPQKKTWRWP